MAGDRIVLLDEAADAAEPAATPTGRRRAPVMLVVFVAAMTAVGLVVVWPGRSGGPKPPIDLPGYGEVLRASPAEIRVLQTLRSPDHRLLVLSLQPGFSAADPDMLSIGADGTERSPLGAAVWAGLNPESDPGAYHQLMTPAADHIVVGSGGRIVARPVALIGGLRDLGPGISVLPGPDPETVWVVTTAGRTLRLVDVSNGVERSEHRLDRGRPLIAGPAGVVLASGRPDDPFILWRPDRPDGPAWVLDGSAGGSLLGLGGDRVVLAVGDEVVVYDLAGLGEPDDGPLAPSRRFAGWSGGERVVQTAVSPDGRHLAVGLVTVLTDPDRIEVVDLLDGRAVVTFSPALAVGFSWAGADQLAHVVPVDGRFRLMSGPLGQEPSRALVEARDLNWAHRVVVAAG